MGQRFEHGRVGRLRKWNGKWPLGPVTLLTGVGWTFSLHAPDGHHVGDVNFDSNDPIQDATARQLAAMILDSGGKINKYWTDEGNPFGDPRISQGVRHR